MHGGFDFGVDFDFVSPGPSKSGADDKVVFGHEGMEVR